MTRWVLLPTFDPGAPRTAVEGWLRTARALAQDPRVTMSDVDLDLPDSVGGGDATWDLETSVPPEELPGLRDLTTPGSGPLRACDRTALIPLRTGSDPFDGPRVKRTLLLTVASGTKPEVVEQFERSVAGMPEHVPEIRSWSLSRLDPARTTSTWTHAWEQEFASLEGLQRGYMRAAYHITAVDRWFDPETPGAIVESTVAHLVRPAAGPVLPAIPDHLVG